MFQLTTYLRSASDNGADQSSRLNQGKLKTVVILAYVAPQIGMHILLGAILVLSGIYAKYYGLSLSGIAGVMLAARMFDAISDPVIGYLSDYWRGRTGSRKPLILAGGILMVPASYALFVPPDDVDLGYFSFWYITFYLAYTLIQIPHMTWANEFTKNSKEKLQVFTATSITAQSGAALFYLLPLLPFFSSTDITPEVLKIASLLGASLILFGLSIALSIVPNGRSCFTSSVMPKFSSQHDESGQSRVMYVREKFKFIQPLFRNKLFVRYVFISLCVGMALGLWGGLFFIYVDAYLNLGHRYGELYLWSLGCGVLSMPIWYRCSLYFGKRNAWLAGMILLALVFLCFGLLRPANADEFGWLFAIKMGYSLVLTSSSIVSAPMLCDIIDFGRLKDNTENSGLYFSVKSLLVKFESAVAAALGLAIVGWFGFDMQSQEHSDISLIAVWSVISWLPAFFIVAAAVLIARMPLTERRMEIVRRRLNIREARTQ